MLPIPKARLSAKTGNLIGTGTGFRLFEGATENPAPPLIFGEDASTPADEQTAGRGD